MEQFRAPGGVVGLDASDFSPRRGWQAGLQTPPRKLGVLVGNPMSAQVCAVHTPNSSWLTSHAPGVKFAAQVW